MTGVVFPLVVLPFAPHERLTTTVKLPLTYKWMRDPGGASGGAYTERGIGDLGLSAKFAFLVHNRFAGTTRVALILGASLPTGSTSVRTNDGLPAPRPLQLGTGAPSGDVTVVTTIVRNRWGLNAAVGHTRHGTDDDFRFGAVTRYDLGVCAAEAQAAGQDGSGVCGDVADWGHDGLGRGVADESGWLGGRREGRAGVPRSFHRRDGVGHGALRRPGGCAAA